MVGKELRSRMALKRCTSNEIRWYKKLASLDSPVLAEIFKPISFDSLLAEELKTPRVSTAIGRKR